MYQVLARKWRPKQFSEVTGQTHIVQALHNALKKQYLHHAYLFSGTRGIGKTSLARILAKCLNCEQGVSAPSCDTCDHCQEISAGHFPDFYEIDAASHTKVEDTRELLKHSIYRPLKGRYKVYLIDEAHMLSGHSFNALLITLEEPPPHVIFLLATTEPQKLPATILSRCLQFYLKPLSTAQTTQRLQHILNVEQISFEPSALELIAEQADGSLRDALSLTEQSLMYGNGQLTRRGVGDMLGIVEEDTALSLLTHLHQKNAQELLALIKIQSEQGIDFISLTSTLLSVLHRLAILQVVPDSDKPELQALKTAFSPEEIQLFYEIVLQGQRDLTNAPSHQIGFEMMVLRMLAFYPETTFVKKTSPPPQKSISSQKTSLTPPATTNTNLTGGNALDPKLPSWDKLVPQLNLTGATLALAKQCRIKSIEGHKIILLLHSKQSPLLQKRHIERLKEAIQLYWQNPVTLSIELEQQHIPDDHASDPKNALQHPNPLTAEDILKQDKQMLKIMDAFDAALDKASIIATDGN